MVKIPVYKHDAKTGPETNNDYGIITIMLKDILQIHIHHEQINDYTKKQMMHILHQTLLQSSLKMENDLKYLTRTRYHVSFQNIARVAGAWKPSDFIDTRLSAVIYAGHTFIDVCD